MQVCNVVFRLEVGAVYENSRRGDSDLKTRIRVERRTEKTAWVVNVSNGCDYRARISVYEGREYISVDGILFSSPDRVA
jgi:hypothetical protein